MSYLAVVVDTDDQLPTLPSSTMDIMPVEECTSVLQLEHSGTQSYKWTFLIPPRSRIINNLAVVSPEYEFKNLQFTTGVLGSMEHCWGLSICRGLSIRVRFRIVNRPVFGVIFHPCELQTFGGDVLINQFLFDLSLGIWSSNFCEWSTCGQIPLSSWNDSVDSLKIVFNIQFESVGQCINLPKVTELDVPASPTVTNDLNTQKYFMSEALSDVTLIAGADALEFHAHRLILSCRSPVFECMFQHQMKEVKEGRVVIDDIEPNVLKEMLRYIYTGKFFLSSTHEDIRVDLFKSADKYGIANLKLELTRLIAQTISLENALDVYTLGEMHNEPTLMGQALKLIKLDKVKALKNPETLQEFTQRYPELAFELLKN